jgi:hypothetical protein
MSKDNRISRTIAAMSSEMARLLYHELAHANDYFPQSIHANIQGPTLVEEFNRRTSTHSMTSEQLTIRYPLQSAPIYGLAAVNNAGETASNTQKAYTPSDIAQFFANVLANDAYAYSSTREDAAMLFEEAMMSHRYGVLLDIAVTNKPEDASGLNGDSEGALVK